MELAPFLSIALLIALALIVVQDLRSRMVHWVLFALALIGFSLKGFLALDTEFFTGFLRNLGFLLIQWAGVTAYFSIKKGRLENIVDRYIGAGDLFFFVALAAAFSPLNFIVFMTTSLVLVALIGILSALIGRTSLRSMRIPLAGILALFTMSVEVLSLMKGGLSPYQDEMLMLMFLN